jgi:hypothetical protein
MKNKITALVILIALLLLGTIKSYSQDSCKVLKPEISTIYQGGCKQGLANGKGTAQGIDKYEGRFKDGLPNGQGIYTWANGNTYNGNWKNGKRQGEGTYKYKKNGADSVLVGVWENDIFIRKITPAPYKVNIVRDLDKYSITKIRDGNKVSLKMQQMGMQNANVTDFSFLADNGLYQPMGNTFVYNQVIFPVTIKISFTTKNKLKTFDVNPVLEVVINEPGEWEIVLTN